MLTIIVSIILVAVFWRLFAGLAIVAIVGAAAFGTLFAIAASVL